MVYLFIHQWMQSMTSIIIKSNNNKVTSNKPWYHLVCFSFVLFSRSLGLLQLVKDSKSLLIENLASSSRRKSQLSSGTILGQERVFENTESHLSRCFPPTSNGYTLNKNVVLFLFVCVFVCWWQNILFLPPTSLFLSLFLSLSGPMRRVHKTPCYHC